MNPFGSFPFRLGAARGRVVAVRTAERERVDGELIWPRRRRPGRTIERLDT